MTTDTKQATAQIQSQTLDYVRQGQDVVVKAVQTWSETWADTLRQWVPSDFGAHHSFNPVELVDQWFDFGRQVLAAQHEFAHSVINAAAPALQATEEAAERTAQTVGTAKPAASKTAK